MLFRSQYPIPQALREIASSHIKDLLAGDIIQSSNSPYASPLIMIKKKTEGYRLVVDYRALNKLIIPDPYPLPKIQSILDNLRGFKYFSTLDLNSSFHQIELDPRDRKLTAFLSPDGQFEYKTLPFGISISPAVFQRLADKLFHNLHDEFIFSYSINNHFIKGVLHFNNSVLSSFSISYDLSNH